MSRTNARETHPHPDDKVEGPDENGVVVYTDYPEIDGVTHERVRRVRQIRVVRSKSSAPFMRPRISPFGSVGQSNEQTTYVSQDEVHIEPPTAEVDKPVSHLRRACTSGDGFNRKQRTNTAPLEDSVASKYGLRRGEHAPGHVSVFRAPYRLGGQEDDPSTKASRTLRISNIDPTVNEDDLRSLCSPYGSLERVYVVKDYHTKVSRGFAFVTFRDRADAERTLEKIRGVGHNNLILDVGWGKDPPARANQTRRR